MRLLFSFVVISFGFSHLSFADESANTSMLNPSVRAANAIYVESSTNISRVTLNQNDKVVPGQSLEPGQHLTTTDSGVRIVYPDGSAMTLGKNSELELKAPEIDEKTKKPVQLCVLKNGFMHVRIHHQGDQAAAPLFFIESDKTFVASRGGEFTMNLGSDLQVHVLEGKLAVANDRSKLSQASLDTGGDLLNFKAGLPAPVEKFNLVEFRKTLSSSHSEVHKLIYNSIKTQEEAAKAPRPRRRRRKS